MKTKLMKNKEGYLLMIRNKKFNNNKQESYLYSSQINCMFKIMLKKLIINK